jgi:hypothetical protein
MPREEGPMSTWSPLKWLLAAGVFLLAILKGLLRGKRPER